VSEVTPPDDTVEPVGVYPAERVKAFADAVVAIAMTLLILPLMESVTEVAGNDDSAGHWFVEHQQQLFSFLLSFVIIAMFWISHHRQFSRVETVTTPLLWLMMAWLLTIVWLPVATSMSGQMSDEDTLVRVVYIGSMILTALMSLAIRLYLRSPPALHHIPDAAIVGGMAADIAMAVLFALALTISLVFPALSYYPLFLMFLSGPLQRVVARILGARR
jgi:uncharacterized membrane protein